MAETIYRGTTVHTCGELPRVGDPAKDFLLVKTDLGEVKLADFPGTRVLNIFPSIDTSTCATSVRTFNERAASHPGVHVLNISVDLPWAQRRFCGAEGIDRSVALSAFRSTFPEDYGVRLLDGGLIGTCTRCVVVISAEGRVVYVEHVADIGQEPDYDRALAAI